jgi:hypothetical protein
MFGMFVGKKGHKVSESLKDLVPEQFRGSGAAGKT